MGHFGILWDRIEFTMENEPDLPMKVGDFPWLYYITREYHNCRCSSLYYLKVSRLQFLCVRFIMYKHFMIYDIYICIYLFIYLFIYLL